MTKRLLTVALFSMLAVATYGQRGKSKQPAFDTTAFNEQWDIARWMVKYDMVARNTAEHLLKYIGTDVVLLGPEWFCFEDSTGMWHALYGRIEEDGQYSQMIHYKVDSRAVMQAVDEQVDSTILNPRGRALRTAYDRMAQATDSLPGKMAPFIRQNPDQTFSVWLLPAFQNYMAVYGGEYAYVIDPSGNHVLRDDSFVSKGGFRELSVEKPAMVWMDYAGANAPTQGAVYFAWFFRSYFPRILIDTDRSVSVLVKTDDDWTWAHNTKSEAPKAKKARNRK